MNDAENIIDGWGTFFENPAAWFAAGGGGGGSVMLEPLEVTITKSSNLTKLIEQHVYNHSQYYNYLNENSSVGQPGELESLIPVWGNGRSAVVMYQMCWEPIIHREIRIKSTIYSTIVVKTKATVRLFFYYTVS